MIEPKTHTIEQPGASREVSSQPAADDKLPSSGPTERDMLQTPRRKAQPAINSPVAAIQLPATRTAIRAHSAWSRTTKAEARATSTNTAFFHSPLHAGLSRRTALAICQKLAGESEEHAQTWRSYRQPCLQDVQIQLLPGYLLRLIRMTSIVASGCLWQRAISCTCGKYTHHHYRQNDDQARCFPGWREENDQNFHETGFVSAVIFPVGIYGWAI
jgi:hypothetical protein